jgi:hypothetical protein
MPSHVAVKLAVPRRKQAVGNVQPLSIQAELQHLRATEERVAFDLHIMDVCINLLRGGQESVDFYQHTMNIAF